MMVEIIPFGTQVRVAVRVEPWYVTAHHERTVRQGGPPSGRWGMYEMDNKGPLQHRAHRAGDSDERDGIPGHDLSDPSPTPERGTWRLLRRFCDGRTGLVVGYTWRAEGQYHAGSRGVSTPSGYLSGEPPAFSESRRERVYQVAVHPGDVGRRLWPVSTVLAIPADLEVLTYATGVSS